MPRTFNSNKKRRIEIYRERESGKDVRKKEKGPQCHTKPPMPWVKPADFMVHRDLMIAGVCSFRSCVFIEIGADTRASYSF